MDYPVLVKPYHSHLWQVAFPGAGKGIKVFRDIGYRGFGLIEFKRDDRDGVLKVTDLTPRWLKTVNLATDSGIDFPLIQNLDLAGPTPSPQHTFKDGVRWLDLRGDLRSAQELYSKVLGRP